MFEVEKSEQFFAMKEINCRGRQERAEAKKEAELMLKLDHENIVRIHSWGREGRLVKPSGQVVEGLVYLFLECISGGLLFDLV